MLNYKNRYIPDINNLLIRVTIYAWHPLTQEKQDSNPIPYLNFADFNSTVSLSRN